MKKKFLLFFNVILFFIAFFLWQVFIGQTQTHFNFLEVNFFDIGRGDAILIELPLNIQILIDGGPSLEIIEKLNKALPFYDRTIEIVILTHPHSDHLNGLFGVFETFRVEKVFLPEIRINNNKEKKLYLTFLDFLQEKKQEIIFVEEGQKISYKGSEFLIFWPIKGLENKEINDFSIVAKFSYGEIDFLFTGDASKKVESQLLINGFDLESEVLKVAHHGSKSASSKNFIERVSSEIAIISVGKNPYGHPNEEVLRLLLNYGIKILRTDRDGDIKIISDGERYETITEH